MKKILMLSAWQDVNIGDIAHTPGMLHVLEMQKSFYGHGRH